VQAGSSLKFCRLAEGAADVYPRMGPTCEWDTAAAQAVLEGAGGGVMDLQGFALRYGKANVLNPAFVAVGDKSWLAA
jgi:3'(2'), 5'-bisphosphate nucleotidase